MVTVLLSQLKSGDKLGEDVLTPFGGVLLRKGEVITPRTMEIMQAFLVSSAVIEDTAQAAKGQMTAVQDDTQQPSAAQVSSDLHDEYDQMVKTLRTVFNSYISGQSFPIMDIRTQLEKLLLQMKSYHILSFAPRSFAETDYYIHNSVCSALTSFQLAQWAGFKQKEWMQIALAGLLKDIGNIRLDRSILTKPTPLTREETEEMKQHTVQGYQLLKNIAALNEGVKLAALQHHERVDGTGYPLGIDSTKIHPYAKIVSIADIFHAMTLNKAYRKAESPYLVLEQLQNDAFGKLDPSYVTVFIEKVTQFHQGTVVRLSDDRTGEIVFSDRLHPTRPWVSVHGQIINLTKDRHLHIKEIVKT